MITYDLSILNQKGTPMFYSDIFANRPNFGVVGRIFISTDTAAIYRDTGSSWVLIADGTGTGTITGSGTAGKIPLWSGTTSLGDSDLIQFSSKCLTLNNPSSLFPTTSFANDAGRLLLYSATNNPALICWGSAAFGSGDEQGTLALGNVTNLGPTTFGGAIIDGYIENAVDGSGGLNIRTTNAIGTDSIALTINSLKNSTFYGYIAATPTLTAANNASSLASYGINTLSYAAGFSSNNIGSLYGGMAGFNLQTFAGSATFAQANVASGGASINSIDFSSAGSTITMTQSSGIRVMSGQQNLFQYQGTNSGTITHAAISQNTGFYRPTGASGTLTITNAYSHLINALDDYGAGFTFTNRWGIYQAGASDTNYFAANMLFGSIVNNGNRLQVTGNASFTGQLIQTLGDNQILYTNTSATTGYQYMRMISTGASLIWGIDANPTASLFTGSLANSANIGNGKNAPFHIATNGIVRMTIDNIGNTGLGLVPNNWFTSSKAIQIGSNVAPYLALFQQTTSTSDGYIGWGTYLTGDRTFAYTTTGDAVSLYRLNSGQHTWFNGPSGTINNPVTLTQAMTLSSSGNLGIGDTNPLYKLSILDAGGASIVVGATTGTAYLYADNAAATIGTITSTPLRMATNSVERGRFSPAGNFILNSISDPGQKLYVNGSLRIDGQTSGTSGGFSGLHLIVNCDGTNYKIRLENV